MPSYPRNLDRIRTDLQSDSIDVRRKAMMELSYWVQKDRSIDAEALPLFRAVWQRETDPWIVYTAARGIGLTGGEAEGRAALFDLLERPQQDIVATAVLNMERELSTARLLELCERATHMGLRRSLVNVLGRKGGPGAYEVLVAALDAADLRPWGIAALARLGDPAAIPHIQQYLSDTSEAWQEDRGPMMRVCDVASDAIGQLNRAGGRAAVPEWPVIARRAGAAEGVAAVGAVPAWSQRPTVPTSQSRGTLFAVVPLAAAIITVPWVLMFVIGVVSVTGKTHDTSDRTRSMDFVAILPPMLGLAVGVYGVVKRRVRGPGRLVLLGVGCLLCMLVSIPFLNEARDITLAEKKNTAAAPAKVPDPPPVRVPIPSGKPPPMEPRQPIDVRPPVEANRP